MENNPPVELNDKQLGLFIKLTRLQQEICINSLSGMNDIDSYRNSSGKSKKLTTMETSVSQIMSNRKVKAFLNEMKKHAISGAVMSRQEMMKELTTLGRTNTNDLITWGYRLVEVLDPDTGETKEELQSFWSMKAAGEIKPEHLKAIEEVTQGNGGLKFKKVSKLAALKQLADLAGYEAPKLTRAEIDNTSSDGSMIVKPSEIVIKAYESDD